jgi:hypothetical protein
MNKYFVTYGFGSNLGQCYSMVEAENYSEARNLIHEITDGAFAFCYDEKEFEGQVADYNLSLIPLQKQVFL